MQHLLDSTGSAAPSASGSSTRLPSLFISHGAPSFALEPGRAGPALAALGRQLPRPQAILIVSPHWMTPEVRVGTASRPATIHDFGGFDPALRRLHYPAEGHPVLAGRTLACLQQAGWDAIEDGDRGLDHGAWVPLLHLFPQADLPVFQVSLPSWIDAPGAWALGEALSPLANEGVLIIGSGSLTHNLHEFRGVPAPVQPYVHDFVAWVRGTVRSGDWGRLRRTLEEAPAARRAHPTPDHFWPLLVAAGAHPTLPTRLVEGGVEYGMLSMDAFVFGARGVDD